LRVDVAFPVATRLGPSRGHESDQHTRPSVSPNALTQCVLELFGILWASRATSFLPVKLRLQDPAHAGAFFGAKVIARRQHKSKTVYDIEVFESGDASSTNNQIFENASGDVLRPRSPGPPFNNWEDVRPGMVVEHM
jgi:hypothetical protein